MKNRYAIRFALVLAVLLGVLVPRTALAANDIMVGMFFASDSDYTNSIYLSYDGKKMTKVSSFYGTNYRDGNGDNHHFGHTAPSVMYYKGKFWAISGWNRYDGKFWPMISYSSDLVHWTHPDGEGLITGTHGIPLNKYPSGFSSSNRGFDTVAPEWFISKNGSVYIIFSAGYYGAFHGNATKDRMQAYIVKVTHLSADEGFVDGQSNYLWPQNLTFRAGTAKRINIPGNSKANANYIDGSMFVSGNQDYLVIKKGGLTNQIYKTTNINKNKWKLVNSKATFGYEGASIAKLGKTFYMVGDHVVGHTADGVKMFKSTKLTKKRWSSAGTKFVTTTGAKCKVRHGSIIVLKQGTPGWRVAIDLMQSSSIKATKKTATKPALKSTDAVKKQAATKPTAKANEQAASRIDDATEVIVAPVEEQVVDDVPTTDIVIEAQSEAEPIGDADDGEAVTQIGDTGEAVVAEDGEVGEAVSDATGDGMSAEMSLLVAHEEDEQALLETVETD